jgi:hypothetical protein
VAAHLLGAVHYGIKVAQVAAIASSCIESSSISVAAVNVQWCKIFDMLSQSTLSINRKAVSNTAAETAGLIDF